MTDRDIFERVRAHLLKQNARSGIVVYTDEEGRELHECRYRGPDGMMCAVGCLVTDEAYDEAMEGASVPEVEGGAWVSIGPSSSAAAVDALNASGIPARYSTMSLLDHLQSLHDSSPVPSWKLELDKMAGDFNAAGEYVP